MGAGEEIKMSIKEMIEVLQALACGKTIQRRATDNGIKLCSLLTKFPNHVLGGLIAVEERWPEHELRSRHDNQGGHFNFTHWEYRIKPEPPKPREWWMLIFEDPCRSPNVYECEQNINGLRCTQVHVREVLPDEAGKA